MTFSRHGYRLTRRPPRLAAAVESPYLQVKSPQARRLPHAWSENSPDSTATDAMTSSRSSRRSS